MGASFKIDQIINIEGKNKKPLQSIHERIINRIEEVSAIVIGDLLLQWIPRKESDTYDRLLPSELFP